MHHHTYVEDDGPVCTLCERRVCRLETTQPARCKICASGTIATLVFQEQMEEAPDALSKALKAVQTRTSDREGHQTLVFLTARKNGKDECLDVGTFDDIWQSLIQNENNPGRFGGTNLPGYPLPMKLVAKFASASSARAPLDMMHERTKDQPEDVLTLNMLADIIVLTYFPGDIVIIAMNDPTNFCVGHQDVESFIREVIASGIPKCSFFFYYHGLVIKNGTVQKNEAVVWASDLRGAILEKLPRYGVGPGRIDSIPTTLSAVLYAMEQGRICDLNTPVPVNRQTSSQCSSKTTVQHRNVVDVATTLCSSSECGQPLGTSGFAISCVQCLCWYHGDCVDITKAMARSMVAQNLVWICRRCRIKQLIDSNDLQEAVDIAVQHNDSSHFDEICRKGQLLGDWQMLSMYCNAFASLGKLYLTHALFATAKCNNRSAFKTLLVESHQLTTAEVKCLIQHFASGQQIDDELIQLLANIPGVDDECHTPVGSVSGVEANGNGERCTGYSISSSGIESEDGGDGSPRTGERHGSLVVSRSVRNFSSENISSSSSASIQMPTVPSCEPSLRESLLAFFVTELAASRGEQVQQ